MALPNCSEYWRSQWKKLQQLLSWASSEGSVGTTLCQALSQPLTQHVQKYILLLLSLRDTLDKVGTERSPRMDMWKGRRERRGRAQRARLSSREGP